MGTGHRLQGKTAIITGGAGGIGRGITTAFVKAGANVLFVDINAEAGAAVQDELNAAGHPGRAAFRHIDISTEDGAERIVAAAVDEFGGVGVLVNNAHASRQAPLLETTAEMFELSFSTGFVPAVRLMKAAYPHLKEAAGSVINFGSGSAMDGMRTQASYVAAKEAIRAVSRVAANEWAADGINVNIICPLAATEGVAHWMEQHPEMASKLISAVPMQRYGDPEGDIGPVAVFLASDDAGYMTGQTLMVDGGSQKLR
ncbi:SDR family NAD(P)-dependent oxidoreductase [Tomitella gaofuii]|uniref:SDR family NAD(P)-dependent oxidoreductase n=1 Tax=Tomitella gaofuii TaxID=2760083 RepID=UPI0015FC669B|nr:SDR family oxidoreductase [Tomitella gaofuii]